MLILETGSLLSATKIMSISLFLQTGQRYNKASSNVLLHVSIRAQLIIPDLILVTFPRKSNVWCYRALSSTQYERAFLIEKNSVPYLPVSFYSTVGQRIEITFSFGTVNLNTVIPKATADIHIQNLCSITEVYKSNILNAILETFYLAGQISEIYLTACRRLIGTKRIGGQVTVH